ncbi:MAG: ParB/RepB/Spo0J family partition protein [Erysipelotrichia bacterium]|nr:ParB/RepB/Spo0J family partition protein [Erysipelotrichia bacterium]
MSDFKKAMEKKGTLVGNRLANSDEALGVNFKDLDNVILADIKIDSLRENPHQPRTSMDQEKLEELKNSILERDLLQPIIVRPLPENPKLFQIIAGHRRTAAMKLLGRNSIPALIMKSDSRDLKIDALIENIQRVDLSPLDEALAIKEIISDSGMKQQDVAKMLGKSKTYVSQALKIASMSPDVIQKIKEGKSLSVSILSEISYIEDTALQNKVFDKVYDNNLSREETRKLIALSQSPKEEKVKEKKVNEPFEYRRNKKNITFKLDLTNIDGKKKAIIELEALLLDLKSSL